MPLSFCVFAHSKKLMFQGRCGAACQKLRPIGNRPMPVSNRQQDAILPHAVFECLACLRLFTTLLHESTERSADVEISAGNELGKR